MNKARGADDRQFDLFVTYLTDLPLRDQRYSMGRPDGSGLRTPLQRRQGHREIGQTPQR